MGSSGTDAENFCLEWAVNQTVGLKGEEILLEAKKDFQVSAPKMIAAWRAVVEPEVLSHSNLVALKVSARPAQHKACFCLLLLRALRLLWEGLGVGLVRAALTLSVALFQLLSSKTAYLNRTWMK